MRAGAGVSEDKEKVMGTDERGEGGEITSLRLSCILIALSWYNLAIPRLGTNEVVLRRYANAKMKHSMVIRSVNI